MIDSSAAIMRAFALAAATTLSASACQSMKMWSGLLQTEPVVPMNWSPLSSWQNWTQAYVAQLAAATPIVPPVPAAEPAEVKPAKQEATSSYRSASGHAVAQVTMGA